VSAGACPPVGEGRRIRDPEASASCSCPRGPPDSRSDIEDIGRPIETIEERFPKRGEVVEADEGGALRNATHKVERLEEDRDIPMDQESAPVTGTDVYGFIEEETRPEEAIRALSETPAVRAERFGGGAPAASGVNAPPGGMARLCTKGILYRGHVARLPAMFFWRPGLFLRRTPY
jgi:hypothetical protein